MLPNLHNYVPFLLFFLSLRFLPIRDPMDCPSFVLDSFFPVSELVPPVESLLFFFGDGLSAFSFFTGDSLRAFRLLRSTTPSA